MRSCFSILVYQLLVITSGYLIDAACSLVFFFFFWGGGGGGDYLNCLQLTSSPGIP